MLCSPSNVCVVLQKGTEHDAGGLCEHRQHPQLRKDAATARCAETVGGVEDAEQLNQLPCQEFAEPPSELGLLLGACQTVKAEILVSV